MAVVVAQLGAAGLGKGLTVSELVQVDPVELAVSGVRVDGHTEDVQARHTEGVGRVGCPG
jgi:hypothetical protein